MDATDRQKAPQHVVLRNELNFVSRERGTLHELIDFGNSFSQNVVLMPLVSTYPVLWEDLPCVCVQV